jgi:hypothetical protein
MDKIGDGECGRQRNVQVDVIGLALRRYDPRIPGLGNRRHISMKTISPLLIYEASPLLCTPDEMEINPEIPASHTRTNGSDGKMINKFVQKEVPGLRPSVLEGPGNPALTGGATVCRAFGPLESVTDLNILFRID